jgi:hypothetical protein
VLFESYNSCDTTSNFAPKISSLRAIASMVLFRPIGKNPRHAKSFNVRADVKINKLSSLFVNSYSEKIAILAFDSKTWIGDIAPCCISCRHCVFGLKIAIKTKALRFNVASVFGHSPYRTSLHSQPASQSRLTLTAFGICNKIG